MQRTRLVGCVVVKDGWVVQSVRFSTYLPVGAPEVTVEYLARWDVDEIFLLDISATHERRPPDLDMVRRVSGRRFVPLTVGGGIRDVSTIERLLRAGADRVSINTAALDGGDFVSKAARRFGAQCIVVSIDVKETGGAPQVLAAGGRRATGLDPVTWARRVEELGAGEILLGSIDRDGTKQGYDTRLIRSVAEAVSIPVVALGGVGRMEHFAAAIDQGRAVAAAAANIFHYMEHSVIVAKAHMHAAGVRVRPSAAADYTGSRFGATGRLERKPGIRFNQIELPD